MPAVRFEHQRVEAKYATSSNPEIQQSCEIKSLII